MELKEILETIALPARCEKGEFSVTEKLEKIKALLEYNNSPYQLIHSSARAWIFGQRQLKYGETVLLVSSHADIVDAITKPSSEYIEDEQYFKGTYDNLGTNAVCVNLMLNENLAGNVYFAFTADEETGKCRGAEYALSFIRNETCADPVVFALDVTDEGYDNDRLFTVEGLHAKSEPERKKMLRLFMGTEGDEQSFEVVRLKKKDDNSFLPKKYQSKELTVYDESVFYAKKNCNSCSICLPGDGYMHSNSGFYIKEPVMLGYSTSLLAGIEAYTSADKEKLATLKAKKDEYVKKAKEIKFHKFKSNYSSYSGYASDYSSNYYGGGLGGYWVDKKRREYELAKEDEQIPGQFSLADYDEEFRGYSDELDDDVSYRTNDPFYLDSVLDEIVEFATCYDIDQFDVFYGDVRYNYGFKDEPELEDYLRDIFNEIHCLEDDYEEEI